MKKAAGKLPRIEKFNFAPGRIIGGTYVVESLLGGGYEGEVYRVTEQRTGVPRTAKLFFPHRNEKDKAARIYAQKLNRLKTCPIIIQYHHAETIHIQRQPVTCLISEYVDGFPLSDFITLHPGKRLPAFKALHLIYDIACGLEDIHWKKEYHGDLHAGNILVMPQGIFFDVKLVDLHHHGRSSPAQREADILDLVHLLYHAVGGKAHYLKQPDEIKALCRGLRSDLILKTLPTVRHLREYLESFPVGFTRE